MTIDGREGMTYLHNPVKIVFHLSLLFHVLCKCIVSQGYIAALWNNRAKLDGIYTLVSQLFSMALSLLISLTSQEVLQKMQ